MIFHYDGSSLYIFSSFFNSPKNPCLSVLICGLQNILKALFLQKLKSVRPRVVLKSVINPEHGKCFDKKRLINAA